LGFFDSLESVSPSPLEGDTGFSLLVVLVSDEDESPVALALDVDELLADSAPGLPGLDSSPSRPTPLVSFVAEAATIFAISRSCLPSARTHWFQSSARMSGQSSGSS
jgi:hypothetical protein